MLIRSLSQYAPFVDAASALRSGQSISLDGAVGSSAALVAAALLRYSAKPLLVVAESETAAENIAEDAETFLQDQNTKVLYFPPLNDIVNDMKTDTETDRLLDPAMGERIGILKQLLFRSDQSSLPPLMIAASLRAVQQHVPPPQTLKARTQTFAVNDRVDLEQLRRELADGGYHATSAVDLPGEFAVRGYILDIFPPDGQQPIRIEFFNDTIESIRRFDSATQRSLERLAEIDITQMPPSEEMSGASLFDYLPEKVPVVWLPCE